MDENEKKLISDVRELSRGLFVERAPAIDLAGAFPADNVNELKALGISRMSLPKAVGGLEVSPACYMRVMEEIAYGDGSTAVAMNMHLLVADFVNMLPPFPRKASVIDDIGRNGALICGPAAIPSGEVDSRTAGLTATEDGSDLILNGKTGFASMSEGAKYAILGGTIDRGEGREPDAAITLPNLDTPGLRIMNNWDAMGLRGSASHDIMAENARVPKVDALVIPQAMIRVLLQAQAAAPPSVELQSRMRGALGITAIWLGLSQAAFDFTVDYVKKRHGYMAGAGGIAGQIGFRADQAWAQFGLGNMEHWLETGRTILYDTVRRLGEPFESQQAFVRHLSRTVYHLRRMSEEVAQGAMRVCGAHAYVRSRSLERIFRDLVGGNVMAWKTDELQLTLGQGALGMPVTFVGPAGT